MKLLVFFFSFSTTWCFAQSTYTLDFQGSNKIDTVEFFDLAQTHFSRVAFSNHIILNVDAPTADLYNIRYRTEKKMHRAQVWLDTGNVEIRLRIANEKLLIDTVIGSPLYYKAKGYQESYAERIRHLDSTGQDRLDFQRVEFINNMNTPYGLYVAQMLAASDPNSSSTTLLLHSLLPELAPEVQSHMLFTLLKDNIDGRLKAQKPLELGRHLYLDRDRNNVTIPAAQSKFRLVDLWFTGCAPCIEQHKTMMKYQNAFSEKGVEIIGISRDRSFPVWSKYLNDHAYSWPNYVVRDESKNNLIDELGIFGFPTYLILGEDGRIIKTFNSISKVIEHFNLAKL